MKNDSNKTKEQLIAELDDLRTQSKKREEEHKESQKKYRLLIENSPDLIAIHNMTEILHINNSGLKLVGATSLDEVVGKSAIDFIHPDDRAIGLENMKKLFSREESKVAMEQRFIRLDGKVIDVEGMGVPINYGEEPMIQIIARDITERKLADKKLLESENNLRTLFNAMTDIVFEMDYDGRYINIAPTSPELMFKPSDDVIGKTLHEVFPKSEADIFLEFIRKCLNENKTNIIEYPMVIDNKTRWFEGSATPKTKNSVLYIARDITERKLAEEALRESEEKWKSLTENSPDYIMQLDLDYKIQFINYTVPGLSQEKVIGKSVLDFVPSDFHDTAIDCFKRVVRSGKVDGYETMYIDADGSKQYFDVRISPLTDSYGKNVGFISTSNNITEPKQAEEALRESEAKFRDMANLLPQIVYEADLKGNLTFGNQQAFKTFGYSLDDFEKGFNVIQILLLEDRAKMKENIQNIINGKNAGPNEYIALKKDGSTFPVLIYSSLIIKDNKPAGFRGIVVDITERKLAEEAIQQRDNYLSALNQTNDILLKGNFDEQLSEFVKIVGKVSQASRTYIFKNHRNDIGSLLLSQIAKYVAQGIKPEIDNPQLQNLSYKEFLPRWQKTLSKGEIISGKVSEFPKSEREILEPQEIKAILVIPIITENEFWGFIGFDNCNSNTEWSKSQIDYLKAASLKLENKIVDLKNKENLENENKRFLATMDAMDAGVYVSDMQTHELIFANKYFTDLLGEIIGKKCYQALQNFNSPCDFCSNHHLLDQNHNPKVPYVWEHKNRITNRWYQLRDQAILWTDGRLVRLEIATDITERKEAEIKLKESEHELKEAQSIAQLGRWDLDLINNHLHWSDGIFKLFEIDPEKFSATYEAFIEAIHPDDREKVDLAYTESLKTKLPCEIEHRLLMKDGRIKWVIEKCRTEYDLQGKPLRSVGVVQNITERKQAEEKIRESEEQFRKMFNDHAAIMLLIDPESGAITNANSAAQLFYGYSHQQLCDLRIQEINQLSNDEVAKEIQNARNQYRNYFFPHKLKNGQIRTVEVHSTPMEINNEKMLFSIIHDITERKQAEQELNLKNDIIKQERDLFIAGSVVVFKWQNADGWPVEYVSPNVKEILGYSAEELKSGGTPYIGLIFPEDIDRVANEVATNSKSGTDRFAHEPYRIVRKDGKIIWIDDYTSIVRNTEGEITHYLGYVIDITERKQAEKEITKLSTAVQQSPSVIAITDTKGNLQYANPKFTELTGYSLEEAIGQNPHVLKSGEQPDEMYKELWETVSAGKVWRGEFHNKKKNGELFWEMASVSPIFDEQGKIVNYIKVAEDITERKQAEDNFRHSIDESPLGIRIVNQKGKTIYV
ncbi:PAS domain S-box protein, partial [Lentimicrobium sp. S6]|uniref:PAS domain S-box protein n=1 Tax=Lentimicrobium sp. S6 TaxID=2735872 RepID=UPI0015547275